MIAYSDSLFYPWKYWIKLVCALNYIQYNLIWSSYALIRHNFLFLIANYEGFCFDESESPYILIDYDAEFLFSSQPIFIP